MSTTFHPIGLIHSPYTNPASMPIQAVRSDAVGQVQLYPEYLEGLRDLDGFSHIILLYLFHRSEGFSLLVKPFLDDQVRGLFATRHPNRPNPIGLSIVELMDLKDDTLTIRGVDILDGTPLLDIKPFVPDFDRRDNATCGWYSHRRYE